MSQIMQINEMLLKMDNQVDSLRNKLKPIIVPDSLASYPSPEDVIKNAGFARTVQVQPPAATPPTPLEEQLLLLKQRIYNTGSSLEELSRDIKI